MYGVGRAGGEGMDADKLPAVDQQFCRPLQILAYLHVVRVADDKALGLIEIRSRFLGAIIVLASHAAAVVKSERCLRLFVNRLAERIGTQKTQVVREALFDFRLKG